MLSCVADRTFLVRTLGMIGRNAIVDAFVVDVEFSVDSICSTDRDCVDEMKFTGYN
jgi:hypothetical protein